MIGLDSQARIWLCTEPTDMRKSFRGLSALVRNQLKHDPLSGQYFVFVNRRKTQMKMLYFNRTDYCLWAKRLEQGQFRVPSSAAGQRALTQTDLQLLIDGIEVQKYRQFKRFQAALPSFSALAEENALLREQLSAQSDAIRQLKHQLDWFKKQRDDDLKALEIAVRGQAAEISGGSTSSRQTSQPEPVSHAH
ncbi:IS66 family insertion sequence element accessory protein TnpB [Marinobacter gelidimuriae]|uniref:IS66 family insertion sequence element accessory protein TnpB n=1 Tax=Marinobacter gelidimuriae TaxID=2739064 RepID=UPI0003618B10|nr:IS66 family insertion sequence element accessory protein TnpB [Marinobacter gelidimuriae]